MRSLIVLGLALTVCACSFVDSVLTSHPSSPSNKVYLGRADFISVPARDTHRYACIGAPLMCEHRGVNFDCRCP